MPDFANSRSRSEELVVGGLGAIVSLAAFLYFYLTGQTLLYGDAVAHINIARRVVDSLTPGPLQLGTVWLPLPHVLMLPLVWIDRLWQSGIAGSIPSMFAYVFGAIGILRLGKTLASPVVGRIAALIYIANPNLIYMQSTGMTESIFLATVIWAVYFLARFVHATQAHDEQEARRALYRCAIASLCAVFTRYDGWFLGGCIVVVVFATWLSSHPDSRRRLRTPLRNFVLCMALGPAGWLAYNSVIFGNAMEFATGPYSARGVAERSTRKGDPPHPGFHNMKTAGVYFLKTSRLNVGEGKREWWLFIIALVGAVLALSQSKMRPALLLWMPIPFYMLSMAYGGVPIFIPEWWPFSYYNVRYGLQLLPAIAICTGIAFDAIRRLVQSRSAQCASLLLIVGAIVGSYASVWRATPICLREARINAVTRMDFEAALAAELRKLPPGARLLMFTGSYVGALQDAGIHLQRVVNEGNYRIWDRALAQPDLSADYVIAVEGDAVALAVAQHPEGLTPITQVHTAAKPPATIYRVSRP